MMFYIPIWLISTGVWLCSEPVSSVSELCLDGKIHRKHCSLSKGSNLTCSMLEVWCVALVSLCEALALVRIEEVLSRRGNVEEIVEWNLRETIFLDRVRYCFCLNDGLT